MINNWIHAKYSVFDEYKLLFNNGLNSVYLEVQNKECFIEFNSDSIIDDANLAEEFENLFGSLSGKSLEEVKILVEKFLKLQVFI